MEEMTMKRMKTLAILLAACALVTLAAPQLFADGCYICGSGSSDSCKHYCRYSGSDTFANRKECEKRGCKISGTASCPTAVNYKVCRDEKRDSKEVGYFKAR
jgi:hypothetical protein